MSLPGLFVTGTDTEVGKTAISCAIARLLVSRGERPGVLKPIVTGAGRIGEILVGDDTRHLIDASAWSHVPIDRVSPLSFAMPAAPSVAAREEGRGLHLGEISAAVDDCIAWWEGAGASGLIVEGVGGWLCPIAEDGTVADLAAWLDLPTLLVARRGLGTLNHTMLTVESIRARGVRISGIVLNEPGAGGDPAVADRNAAELIRWLDGVPVLAEVVHQGDMHALPRALESVNWAGLMRRPRRVATRPAD